MDARRTGGRTDGQVALVGSEGSGRTTLVVAHRLSTVRHAHKLCVLVGGKVVEQGTHDELVRRGGAYAEMVRAQAIV